MSSKRRSRTKKRDDTSSKHKFAVKPKREPKKVTSGTYNSIDYDSLDELAMLQWLFELKAYGYIKKIERAESFLLCDSLVNNYAEQLKKVSSRPMTQTLLHGHSYTPEFKITWDKKARDKIVWMSEDACKFDKVFVGRNIIPPMVPFDTSKRHYTDRDIITYIEVKPSFDQNNMERLFKINQKWMWEKHSIFVNLVKVQELFPKTFTPKAYLTTPTGRVRLIKWKAKTLSNYLNGTKQWEKQKKTSKEVKAGQPV